MKDQELALSTAKAILRRPLSTELEAMRLAARTLDEKIDKLTFDQGYGNMAADTKEGQILRNYQKAFDIITERINAMSA